MAKHTTSVQHIDQSSFQLDFVNVILSTTLAPARVAVSAGAFVYHVVVHDCEMKHYYLAVFIDDLFVGWHCGARTGSLVLFSRKSDAVRLCGVRDAAFPVSRRCATRRSVKEVA